VFSEDGDELTGAGVYDSPVLEGSYSFGDFRGAVLQVFKSVDSKTATQYRESHGISDEHMCVIVQEYIKPSTKGQIDTVVRGIPELLRIRLDDGTEIILNKAKLRDFVLAKDELRERTDVFHYQLDAKRVDTNFITKLVKALAQLMMIVEKFYDKQVQIEFGISSSGELFTFQVRPLPQTYSERADVEFPESQESIFEGRALGIGDVELDILSDSDEDNATKKGVVILSGSHLASFHHPERYFPESGAVILLKGARDFGGHLEMICAERGILVIIGEDELISDSRGRLSREKKLHLVLNGLIGKVYRMD